MSSEGAPLHYFPQRPDDLANSTGLDMFVPDCCSPSCPPPTGHFCRDYPAGHSVSGDGMRGTAEPYASVASPARILEAERAKDTAILTHL
jgi:hypothetical protein